MTGRYTASGKSGLFEMRLKTVRAEAAFDDVGRRARGREQPVPFRCDQVEALLARIEAAE